jgi:drug/metabolite transporter (DMT)-like permease
MAGRRLPNILGSGFVILGVGYQWLYNGVNFLAFKVGGDAFHPLTLATLRFDIATILILPFAAWRWRLRPASMRELAGAVLLGPIMLIGGQTLAICGTQFLPAGVASVFGSAAPVFLALFAWIFFRQTLDGRQVAGIALGLLGLAAMAWLSSSGTGFRPIGAAMTLTASALWAAGSLGASRLRLPADSAIGLAAQLLPTGVLLTVLVWLTGISASLHPSAVPLRAWGVLAFLIVASTLIGYAVFLALNRSASSMLANSFNYVAPVIALVLSAWFLNEPVGWEKLTAAGVTLSGVALMVGARTTIDNSRGTPKPKARDNCHQRAWRHAD